MGDGCMPDALLDTEGPPGGTADIEGVLIHRAGILRNSQACNPPAFFFSAVRTRRLVRLVCLPSTTD